jgi:hypothetical protein
MQSLSAVFPGLEGIGDKCSFSATLPGAGGVDVTAEDVPVVLVFRTELSSSAFRSKAGDVDVVAKIALETLRIGSKYSCSASFSEEGGVCVTAGGASTALLI